MYSMYIFFIAFDEPSYDINRPLKGNKNAERRYKISTNNLTSICA